MASKGDTEKGRRCAGEVPGEKMAPWDASAVGNPPLSENHRTLHTQGSLSLVNKLIVHTSKII